MLILVVPHNRLTDSLFVLCKDTLFRMDKSLCPPGLQLQAVFFQKKIINTHCGNSNFISCDIDNIFHKNNLLKKVIYTGKGHFLLKSFFLRGMLNADCI